MITPAICREARASIKWSRDRLAARAGITCNALRRFELERTGLNAGDQRAVRQALEAAGVEFTDGDAPAVRVRTAEAS